MLSISFSRHTKNLFFISLQYNAPHWPWQVPGDEPYPLGETISDFVGGGSLDVYAGMVKNLDMNIGRLLHALDEAGLTQSTIIIFTSDNGGAKFSDMGPFQGRKGNLFEGGIRVPAAVRWPEVISPGTESEQPVITMDWTVTMLALAKAEIPRDLAFDGMNLTPHLQGNTSVTPRKLYWRTGEQHTDDQQDAYRDGDWKYLKTIDGEFLFDLENDAGETMNLKNDNPEKFIQLKSAFQELDSEMLDRLILSK